MMNNELQNIKSLRFNKILNSSSKSIIDVASKQIVFSNFFKNWSFTFLISFDESLKVFDKIVFNKIASFRFNTS